MPSLRNASFDDAADDKVSLGSVSSSSSPASKRARDSNFSDLDDTSSNLSEWPAVNYVNVDTLALRAVRCRIYAEKEGGPDSDDAHLLETEMKTAEMLRTLGANSRLCTLTHGLGHVTRSKLAEVHNTLIHSLHQRYLRVYEDQNSAWLQITSLALSYFYTAMTTWANEPLPLPDLEYTMIICYRLGVKFQGGCFEHDEVADFLTQCREHYGLARYDALELHVLDALDWRLLVITDFDLVQHCLEALEPDVAGAIRKSTNITMRLIQESSDWALQDRSIHAANCVHDSLSQLGAEVEKSRWSSKFRRCLGLMLDLQGSLVGYQ